MKLFGFGNGVVSGMLHFFKNGVFEAKIVFLAQPVTFYALLGSEHQTHPVVFLHFDGAKLLQFFCFTHINWAHDIVAMSN